MYLAHDQTKRGKSGFSNMKFISMEVSKMLHQTLLYFLPIKTYIYLLDVHLTPSALNNPVRWNVDTMFANTCMRSYRCTATAQT